MKIVQPISHRPGSFSGEAPSPRDRGFDRGGDARGPWVETMLAMPSITVLVSVYNGVHTLESTLQSVAMQSLTDWHCLVINDGSQDGSALLLDRLTGRDPRFSVIHHPINQGLSASLAEGLGTITSPLVARLDCGDRMAPERLEVQKEALLTDSSLLLVGSRARLISKTGEFICQTRLPLSRIHHSDLASGNPFLHASVMFRRAEALAAGGYDPRYRYAQDYALWTHLLERGDALILPQPLIDLVLDDGGLTVTRRSRQIRYRELARIFMMRRRAGESPGRVGKAEEEALARLAAEPSSPSPSTGPSIPYSLRCARAALAQGDGKAARRFARRGFPEAPLPSLLVLATSLVPDEPRMRALSAVAGWRERRGAGRGARWAPVP